MPGFLRQSTASQQRAIGPFLDSVDFLTAETGLTIANTDVKLVINGAASVNKNSGGGTHRVNGIYSLTFDATDTATVGQIDVSVVVAGALPVFDRFQVLEEAVFDAMFATSATGQFSGVLLAATQTGVTIPTVTTVGTVNALAANSVTAAATAADFNTELAQTVWNANQSAHNSAGTFGGNLDVAVSSVSGGSFTNADFGIIDSGTAQGATSTTIQLRAAAAFATAELVGAIVYISSASTGSGQARQITSYVGATDTATVDAWTTTPTGTITYRIFAQAPASVTNVPPVNVVQWNGSAAPANTGDAFARLGAPVGVSVSADISAVKSDTASAVTKATDLQARVPAALVSGRMDASVGAMAANTVNASALATDAVAEISAGVVDQSMTGHTTSGTVGGALNSASSAADPLAAVVPGGYGAGTFGKLIADNLNVPVSSRSSQTALDTVDTVVDSIKSKTDSLTFTSGTALDANIKRVNDVSIAGTGVEDSDEWRPA